MTTIERHAAIASLAAEWDALADRLGADPFVRPGWIGAWTSAFGGGRVELLAARREGRLAGVLALVRRAGAARSPTNAHTPHFDVLAQDGPVARALVAAAIAERPRVLSLGYLDPADPGREAIEAIARESRWPVSRRVLLRSPWVAVEGDFDAYRRTRDRRFLADLRRRRRRLAEEGVVSLTVSTGADGVAAPLTEFLELEASGWKAQRRTAIAARYSTRSFYEAVAAWGATRGTLRLIVVRLDGRPLSAVFALEEAGALYLLKGGRDPAAARFSPGVLVLAAAIEHAFVAGLERVELGGGPDRYKLEWADDVRERVIVHACAPTSAGRLARVGIEHARPLAERAGLDRALRPARDRLLTVLDRGPRRGRGARR